MGNTNLKFEANLKKLIYEYVEIVKQLAANKIFSSENSELDSAVNTYLEYFIKDNVSNITNCDNNIKLIWSIHKIHPIIYHKKNSIDSKWLTRACLHQHIFAKKIEKMISDLNSSNIKKIIKMYKSFLLACKKNPEKILVPSLSEDLVWCAHMQDAASYMVDMETILGFLLDYRDDCSDEKIEKYKKDI